MARILVIEDTPDNLELMIYLLGAFGHTLLSAGDGATGLLIAQRDQPDLIVCDIQMPVMDGYAVALALKADPTLRSIPLVAVTALAMVGDRGQILGAGFDGYIAKPIVAETFVTQIESFLPLVQRTESAPVVAQTAASPPTSAPMLIGRTILVVDDRPINHDLMRGILEPFGYVVIAAGSVREALDLVRAQPPDLIVSDLHMPDQDGFDLIRAIKADPQLRSIKIVIHSATIGSAEDRGEALRLGALRFITRPMEPQMLLDEIVACLEATPKPFDTGDSPP